MSYYPNPDGFQQQGGGGYPQHQGYSEQQGGGGYPQNQGYSEQQGGAGYPQNQGYPQQESYGGGQGYQQQSQGGFPGGFPQQQEGYGGGGGGYEGGPLPGGFQDASQVPEEHLPPGYNPATKRAYEAHEIPRGASPAPDGYEGYIPEGMSQREAHERGFIGTAGGGLLGAWLGHKFGHKHGHGFLGTIGGAGLGGWLGGKIL